jgi:hypothetical protein
VADDFSQRYGDLLAGSYDCVDRVVLNAYFPLGHSPGGFRTWWRQLHDGCDGQLDDTHLMRMSGRFARRVRAWAAASDVPLIYCKAGERKHQIAAEYLRTHPAGPGVFLILVAKAPAPAWKVKRPASGVITNLEKKTEYVSHYSFHVVDPRWGHLVIKMPGIRRLARRSSSTGTSTWRPPRRRPGSDSPRRTTALPESRIRRAWLRSQIPCRSLRL